MQIRRRPPNPAVAVQSLRYQVAVPDAAPRHILEEIVWHKEVEVDQMRERLPLVKLQQQVKAAPPPHDLSQHCAKAKLSLHSSLRLKKHHPVKA
ncbi:MAG: hypothetical protein HC899_15015 [Leptolyngbyaceae cyanobacterium SM1_4_3]|nr:hypothetical protein [Leptolyngbyaceae cyanobacterium SM1_4_3]